LIAVDEKLIESVRQREELYDIWHKDFSENTHKEKLCRAIDEQLKKSGEAQYFIKYLFTVASNFLALYYHTNGYK
jgi:uncharacterized Ntn-hydrolase superfamily protein